MGFISAIKHISKVFLRKEKISFIPVLNNEVDKTIIYENLNESKIISQNKKQFRNLIAIDGVGFSGSSALGDFLGEFSNCTSLGGVELRENPGRGIENSFEIDFLREPGGIIDLERICYSNTNRIKDEAVHQFIDVCKEYYSNDIPFFGDYFMELSKKFIKEITSYAFKDSINHFSYFPKRMSIKEYRNYAQEYILSILKEIPSQENLVCDNLASVGRPDFNIVKDYLGDCKVLINYCDPRDAYARARLQPGNDWVPIDPEIFVMNWKQNYIPLINTIETNTLVTNFDDFCNDYETQAKKIMDFIGLEEKDHILKFKYFNPKVSINNTGVWRKIENQKAIEYIFENLKEYCYDTENHKRYSN